MSCPMVCFQPSHIFDITYKSSKNLNVQQNNCRLLVYNLNICHICCLQGIMLEIHMKISNVFFFLKMIKLVYYTHKCTTQPTIYIYAISSLSLTFRVIFKIPSFFFSFGIHIHYTYIIHSVCTLHMRNDIIFFIYKFYKHENMRRGYCFTVIFSQLQALCVFFTKVWQV